MRKLSKFLVFAILILSINYNNAVVATEKNTNAGFVETDNCENGNCVTKTSKYTIITIKLGQDFSERFAIANKKDQTEEIETVVIDGVEKEVIFIENDEIESPFLENGQANPNYEKSISTYIKKVIHNGTIKRETKLGSVVLDALIKAGKCSNDTECNQWVNKNGMIGKDKLKKIDIEIDVPVAQSYVKLMISFGNYRNKFATTIEEKISSISVSKSEYILCNSDFNNLYARYQNEINGIANAEPLTNEEKSVAKNGCMVFPGAYDADGKVNTETILTSFSTALGIEKNNTNNSNYSNSGRINLNSTSNLRNYWSYGTSGYLKNDDCNGVQSISCIVQGIYKSIGCVRSQYDYSSNKYIDVVEECPDKLGEHALEITISPVYLKKKKKVATIYVPDKDTISLDDLDIDGLLEIVSTASKIPNSTSISLNGDSKNTSVSSQIITKPSNSGNTDNSKEKDDSKSSEQLFDPCMGVDAIIERAKDLFDNPESALINGSKGKESSLSFNSDSIMAAAVKASLEMEKCNSSEVGIPDDVGLEDVEIEPSCCQLGLYVNYNEGEPISDNCIFNYKNYHNTPLVTYLYQNTTAITPPCISEPVVAGQPFDFGKYSYQVSTTKMVGLPTKLSAASALIHCDAQTYDITISHISTLLSAYSSARSQALAACRCNQDCGYTYEQTSSCESKIHNMFDSKIKQYEEQLEQLKNDRDEQIKPYEDQLKKCQEDYLRIEAEAKSYQKDVSEEIWSNLTGAYVEIGDKFRIYADQYKAIAKGNGEFTNGEENAIKMIGSFITWFTNAIGTAAGNIKIDYHSSLYPDAHVDYSTDIDCKFCTLNKLTDDMPENDEKSCACLSGEEEDCPGLIVCEDTDCIKNGFNIVYRTISLINPFPNDREKSIPWTSDITVDRIITNNRNVKGYDVYKLEPMYTITLTPTDISKIRQYNKTHSYNDFNLKCNDNGLQCESNFLHTTLDDINPNILSKDLAKSCAIGGWYACEGFDENFIEGFYTRLK